MNTFWLSLDFRAYSQTQADQRTNVYRIKSQKDNRMVRSLINALHLPPPCFLLDSRLPLSIASVFVFFSLLCFPHIFEFSPLSRNVIVKIIVSQANLRLIRMQFPLRFPSASLLGSATIPEEGTG